MMTCLPGYAIRTAGGEGPRAGRGGMSGGRRARPPSGQQIGAKV